MLARDDEGRATPTTQFDYDAVDANLFGAPDKWDLKHITPQEAEAAFRMFRALLTWIFQNGMKNPQGVLIRAIIMCWIFLPELRSLQLSQMARAYNMDKQSLGRWVDVFKQDFPTIKTPHMRHDSSPPRIAPPCPPN